MKNTTKYALMAVCLLMIFSLPFFLPSGAMLSNVKNDLLNETNGEEDFWDDFSFLLFPSAFAEEDEEVSFAFPTTTDVPQDKPQTTMFSPLPIDFTPGLKANPKNYTDTGYVDDSISIQMKTLEQNGVQYCIGTIALSSPSQLRTAVAGTLTNTRVANISSMAEKHNAILAINADNFTNNPTKTSFEYRMGEKIRSKPNRLKDILIIDDKGDFHLFVQSDGAKMKKFQQSDLEIINAFTFGPALVIDSAVQTINKDYGYNPRGKEPRMAIGQTGPLNYVVVMAEGRSSNSEGVTHQTLANFMGALGCTQAYNLDGGNSATMVFNGEFYGSRTGNERAQSDMIYFATNVDEATWNNKGN